MVKFALDSAASHKSSTCTRRAMKTLSSIVTLVRYTNAVGIMCSRHITTWLMDSTSAGLVGTLLDSSALMTGGWFSLC